MTGDCPTCGGHDPLDGREPACRCGSSDLEWAADPTPPVPTRWSRWLVTRLRRRS